MQDSPSKPLRPDAPRLADFPVHAADIVRFGDLDRQGHVNNAVYATYFETGRVGVIYDREQGLQVPGTTSVLARLEIDFRKELRWPATLAIGSAVAEIGRSSYTLVQAVFAGDVCAATARAKLVLIDAATRKSRPLPPELVERLERLRLRGG